MGRDLPALTGIAALRYTYQRAIPSLAKKEQERLTAGSLCVLSTMQRHDAQVARCAAQIERAGDPLWRCRKKSWKLSLLPRALTMLPNLSRHRRRHQQVPGL
jgi:hypothetical protein